MIGMRAAEPGGEVATGPPDERAEDHPAHRRLRLVAGRRVDRLGDAIGDAGIRRVEVERGAVGAAEGHRQGSWSLVRTHGVKARQAVRIPRVGYVKVALRIACAL